MLKQECFSNLNRELQPKQFIYDSKKGAHLLFQERITAIEVLSHHLRQLGLLFIG